MCTEARFTAGAQAMLGFQFAIMLTKALDALPDRLSFRDSSIVVRATVVSRPHARCSTLDLLEARRLANWLKPGSGCPDQGLHAQNNVMSFRCRTNHAKSASPL